jgi:hypothetical protein
MKRGVERTQNERKAFLQTHSAHVAQSCVDARADIGIQGGLAGIDGLFNNNDFVVFITWFFAGC